MGWLKQSEILSLPSSSLKDTKFQSVNRFGLLLVFNPNIPHGGVKTFVTS
jgi:hypothetical protein